MELRKEAGFPWGLVVMVSIPVVFEFIFLVLVRFWQRGKAAELSRDH